VGGCARLEELCMVTPRRFALLTASFTAAIAAAQTLQWQARFDARVPAIASPAAFHLQPDGAAYFVLTGNLPPFLVHQTPHGTIAWQSAIPRWSERVRLAIDSLGRAIVAETVSVDYSRNVVLVTQYDSLGSMRWTGSFSGQNHTDVRAIFIDQADQIYIAGDT